MKKFLIITPYCPFPPNKSGGINTLFNLVKENNKFNNQIDLLFYDKNDEQAKDEVAGYFNNVFHLDLRKKGKLTRIISMLKEIPYGIYQYDENLLEITNEYDKVILDQPLSMNLINKINVKESALLCHDSMSLYFRRKANMSNINLIEKVYSKMQSKYYYKIEKKLFSKFDKIIFVSEKDALYEKKLNVEIKDKIDNINLGVDYRKFDSSKYKTSKNKNVIFTGIMSYAPNKDAAIFFATKIMPRLLEIDKEIVFIIAGRDPDKDVLNLQSDNIKVTGFVNDIVENIADARVYVSPLRFGTGVKNKVLEAMSCKKAIVASEISIEGITELEQNKNIYVADTEDEWVNYVTKALVDDEVNEKFGQQCREIILSKYKWENAYNKIFN